MSRGRSTLLWAGGGEDTEKEDDMGKSTRGRRKNNHGGQGHSQEKSEFKKHKSDHD